MITDVPGVRVGHWTDAAARTGCTVVLFPAGTVASGEVRGGAPATREFDLLAPERLVARVDAVLLGGGSAFGLAAADGVVRWCEERGVGFPTAAGPVPIVVAACIFDLMVGDASVRPGPDEGYAACEAATDGSVEVGVVGAGTGATVHKWEGPDGVRPGGVGTASCRAGDVVVGALVVVNALGDLPERAGDAEAIAGPLAATTAAAALASAREHTTVGVVVTNATLDKTGCLLVAQSGHDGMARALVPVHATVDGDALVAASVGGVDAPVEVVRVLAAAAVERAIRSALST